MAKKFWLMKSEPESYSISDLKKDKTTLWEGVRNYQARNFMMNEMKIGDEIIFYHSNAEPPGAAGVCRVSGAAQPDPSQFDKKSDYFDPRATKEKPIWFCVEVQFLAAYKDLIPLEVIKKEKALSAMSLLQKGQRLSVQPVQEKEFRYLTKMAGL